MSEINGILNEYIKNVEKKEQLKTQIRELNTEQKALQTRIMEHMQEEKTDYLDYGEFQVTSYVNVHISKTKKRKQPDENKDPNLP
jgi:SAM-dependent MidA family methyltransferase